MYDYTFALITTWFIFTLKSNQIKSNQIKSFISVETILQFKTTCKKYACKKKEKIRSAAVGLNIGCSSRAFMVNEIFKLIGKKNFNWEVPMERWRAETQKHLILQKLITTYRKKCFFVQRSWCLKKPLDVKTNPLNV